MPSIPRARPTRSEMVVLWRRVRFRVISRVLADDPGRAEDGEKVGRLHAQKTWRLPGGDGASGEVGFRLGIAHLVSSANREASWHSSIKMPQDWWRLGNLGTGALAILEKRRLLTVPRYGTVYGQSANEMAHEACKIYMHLVSYRRLHSVYRRHSVWTTSIQQLETAHIQ